MPCLPDKTLPACLTLFLALFLCACGEDRFPPGVVALVNGEPITLHSVQNLLDSRSMGSMLQADTSFEDLRANYGRAVAMLIATTLVRQELEERGIAPDQKELDQAIERIRSDYGEGGLEEFLEEAYLRPDDWKQLMRDHLAMEVFRNQVLLPTIKIEFQDIKNYYQEHRKEFVLPETARACFLSSLKREEVQAWCSDVRSRKFLDDAVAQCVEVAINEISQPWNRELKSLKPMSCGKIREEDGEWQAVALLERTPERAPELSEVFPLVEKILLEPRQSAAFEQWLAQKSATAKVLVAPGLRDALAFGGGKSGVAAKPRNEEDRPD